MINVHQDLLTAAVSATLLCMVACGPSSPSSEKSAAPETAKKISAAEWLAKDSIGIFRGAEFGDETGTIRQMENDSFLVFSSPNLLQYEYLLPGERRYKLEY